MSDPTNFELEEDAPAKADTPAAAAPPRNEGEEDALYFQMLTNGQDTPEDQPLKFDDLTQDQQAIAMNYMFMALFANLTGMMENGVDDSFAKTLGFDDTEALAAWQAPARAALDSGRSSLEDIVRDIPDFSKFDFKNSCGNPLLDMISVHESGGDYNIICGGRRINLTEMTIDQVSQWQKENNPPGKMTAAAGRYQIINSTLEGLKESMGLKGDELFDEEMQDRMATALLEQRGMNRYLNGTMPESEFMENLSKEWASLPKNMGGRSYYAGDGVNAAHQTPEVVLSAMRAAREEHLNPELGRARMASRDIEPASEVAPVQTASLTQAHSAAMAAGGHIGKAVDELIDDAKELVNDGIEAVENMASSASNYVKSWFN